MTITGLCSGNDQMFMNNNVVLQRWNYSPSGHSNARDPPTPSSHSRCLKKKFSARNSGLFCNFLLFGGGEEQSANPSSFLAYLYYQIRLLSPSYEAFLGLGVNLKLSVKL